ncbi:MAG TPA: hypothetical protein VME43_32005 [Bryobacteraceae bacterium]|nr:hypothetical protein [Bryobacteraceae bacterium]
MALFTDGPVSTIEELAGHDSQLLNVATVEGIDVTTKLELAQEELGIELETLLERRLLDKVVVTPPLRLWHAYRSLEMVYQDAYSNQLNDRYANKRDEFRDLARWAMDRLIRLGVGLVHHPVPKAAEPCVTLTPGLLPDGTYYATVSWVNAAGEEGDCADVVSVVTASSTFVVNPRRAPGVAVGWNVYAGAAPEQVVLQNTVPNPVGATWVQPEPLVTDGKRPGQGQGPNTLYRIARRISRG